ncbi:hypothetical protein G9C98_007094 [Cotesia typhae]|uniref:Uncharacterized protein n=1 Tax=Cotesia typhae TaxID=2053667 RepID=A0A8J5UYC4_9HYME|nr:hypothetical protein G9C98_007094 [Cotesia typhae]
MQMPTVTGHTNHRGISGKDAGRIGDEMKHAACVVAVSRLRGPAFNPWCPPVATSPCTPFPVILSTSSLRKRLEEISRGFLNTCSILWMNKAFLGRSNMINQLTTQLNTVKDIIYAKSRVKEVYAQTCVLLGQQGMRDCELFGLAILSVVWMCCGQNASEWTSEITFLSVVVVALQQLLSFSSECPFSLFVPPQHHLLPLHSRSRIPGTPISITGAHSLSMCVQGTIHAGVSNKTREPQHAN